MARTDTLSTYRPFSLSARTRVSPVASRPARLNSSGSFKRRSNWVKRRPASCWKASPTSPLGRNPPNAFFAGPSGTSPSGKPAIRAVPPSTGLANGRVFPRMSRLMAVGIFRGKGSMSTEVSVLMILPRYGDMTTAAPLPGLNVMPLMRTGRVE